MLGWIKGRLKALVEKAAAGILPGNFPRRSWRDSPWW